MKLATPVRNLTAPSLNENPTKAASVLARAIQQSRSIPRLARSHHPVINQKRHIFDLAARCLPLPHFGGGRFDETCIRVSCGSSFVMRLTHNGGMTYAFVTPEETVSVSAMCQTNAQHQSEFPRQKARRTIHYVLGPEQVATTTQEGNLESPPASPPPLKISLCRRSVASVCLGFFGIAQKTRRSSLERNRPDGNLKPTSGSGDGRTDM